MPSTITDRLQGLTTSVAVKAPCVVASTGAITLTSTSTSPTYDGVTLPSSGRILLKDQANENENGIYLFSGSTFARAKDWNGARDAVPGTLVSVRSGTLYAGALFTVNPKSTATSIDISTDAMAFSLPTPRHGGLVVEPIINSTDRYFSIASSSEPNLAAALPNQAPVDLVWGTSDSVWVPGNNSENYLFRGRTNASIDLLDIIGIDFRSVLDGGSSGAIVGGRFWGTVSTGSSAPRGGTGVEGVITSLNGGALHASNFNVNSSGVATGNVHGCEYDFNCQVNASGRYGVHIGINNTDTADITGTLSPANSTADTIVQSAGITIAADTGNSRSWATGILTIAQINTTDIQIEDNLWYGGGWSSSYGLNWGRMTFGQAAMLLPNNSAIKAYGSASSTEITMLIMSTDNEIAIGSSWTAAGRTCADLGTVTTIDLNGGSIDAAVIGAASRAAGNFTTIDATGNYTNSGQPAFLAVPSGAADNVTGASTVYTIVYGTERFDQGADFDGVSTFTAPVTGKYFLQFEVRLDQMSQGVADEINLSIITSNNTYRFHWNDNNALGANHTVAMSGLFDMDANDTVTTTVSVVGEASDVVDISTTQNATYFSGYLAA